jgi:hypothetical protein
MVGGETKPQHVNNWRRRGVPSTHANLVAGLLGCRPEEISAAIPSANPIHTDQQLGSGEELLIALCDGFSAKQIAALSRAATWIREGRTITASDPPSQQQGGRSGAGQSGQKT